MFFAGYVTVYVFFVVIQTVVFNAHRTGKGGGIDFLMVVCAIPFLIGFVPAWWLSRYVCAGRSGWARHGLVGIGSGLLALGIAYALILGGVI